MKRFYSLVCSLTFLLLPSALTAEIINATIIWNVAHCDVKCARRLEAQLNRMNEVNRVDFDGEAGKATLYWRPGQSMRANTFNRIATSNSLNFHRIDITLRGVIKRSGRRYFINSLGDQTQIEILTLAKQPPEREEARQPYLYNKRYARATQIQSSPLQEKTTYSLSKRMAGRLDEVIKSDKILTLTGTVVDPQSNVFQMIMSEDSVME